MRPNRALRLRDGARERRHSILNLPKCRKNQSHRRKRTLSPEVTAQPPACTPARLNSRSRHCRDAGQWRRCGRDPGRLSAADVRVGRFGGAQCRGLSPPRSAAGDRMEARIVAQIVAGYPARRSAVVKFLIDECLSPALAALARQRGYLEPTHVTWLGMASRKDRTVAQRAVDDGFRRSPTGRSAAFFIPTTGTAEPQRVLAAMRQPMSDFCGAFVCVWHYLLRNAPTWIT